MAKHIHIHLGSKDNKAKDGNRWMVEYREKGHELRMTKPFKSESAARKFAKEIES